MLLFLKALPKPCLSLPISLCTLLLLASVPQLLLPLATWAWIFLYSLLKLLLTLYAALFVFLGGLLFSIAYFLRIPIRQFIKAVSEPVSIAFATTSSESALADCNGEYGKIWGSTKNCIFCVAHGLYV